MKGIDMETLEFHEGDCVVWIPYYAEGNASHRDCVRGVVVGTTKVSNKVLVRPYNRVGTLERHWETWDPQDLKVEYTEYYV
jgi:hypothetical protein